jgi:hypothetical protein
VQFDATGGKSGATFQITDDGRFVLKQINEKELAMFLEAAPAYFEYMSRVRIRHILFYFVYLFYFRFYFISS